MKTSRNFRNYKVWQDAVVFATSILGSAYEVETQLLIAKNIGYVSEEQHADLLNRIVEIEKQLSGLINSIKSVPS